MNNISQIEKKIEEYQRILDGYNKEVGYIEQKGYWKGCIEGLNEALIILRRCN